MKKVSFILLAATFLAASFYCTPEHQEEAAGIASVDAEAFGSAVLACSETGMGLLCEPCCLELGTAAGIIASAEAGTSHRVNTSRGLAKTNEIDIILPAKYKLSKNPYECAGEVHNRMLFYILNHDKETQIQKILTGDESSLNRLVNMYSDCSPDSELDKVKIIAHLKNNLNQEYYNNNLAKYKGISKKSLIQTSGLLSEKVRFDNIYNEVLIIKRDNPNDTEKIMEFINSKISSILNSKDSNSNSSKALVGTLTVLKHSYYYWNN
jgi:hypothetical protein